MDDVWYYVLVICSVLLVLLVVTVWFALVAWVVLWVDGRCRKHDGDDE